MDPCLDRLLEYRVCVQLLLFPFYTIKTTFQDSFDYIMIKAANPRVQINVAEEVLDETIDSEGLLSSLLLRAGGKEKNTE